MAERAPDQVVPSGNGDVRSSPLAAADPRASPGAGVGAPPSSSGAVRQRGWLEVRWRQVRRAPPPVVRAVASSTAIATILGVAFLVYDVAISRGATLPGGDLRTAAGVAFVVAVVVLGSWTTYLAVPQPGRPDRRSGWSAVLGLLAALPIAYLALVVLFQVLKPIVAP